ncbi:hypothetical protein [Mesorhizobium sp. ES1-1]|uniref:hypothetical protein n=1 Tax=Mesorhizobium sp. ES1-1 TaxID=2876629 RepID=UPI001CCEE2B9|nr:hypothetical protein [Mesorhizobium sp. ES1-1]MBZ9675788.1 hypothetical protein [Mesorhizobium sp. ES1-1]
MNSVPPAEAKSTGPSNVRKTRKGAGLPCTVVWYGEEGELARTLFPDENSANAHVIAMLQINMLIGNVVSVEIRQPDGRVLSSHYGPRPQKEQTAPLSVDVGVHSPETLQVEVA